jgi:hypothetical protein
MLRTIAVALAVLTAIAGAGLFLEAEALGHPSTARLELVRTLRALLVSRRSTAVIQLGVRRYVATCRPHAVSVNGHLLREVKGRLIVPRADRAAFELAGCPRPLLRRLSTELLGSGPLKLVRATVDGVRTWRVRIAGKGQTLELFVSRRTGLPVELVLEGRTTHGTSDVAYSL